MSPFVFSTRIRFIDTDASGRIHYTCLFRYFESAEIEFLRTMELAHDPDAAVAFPRVHAECDYKLALRHDDPIDIEVRVGHVGASSIRFEFLTKKDGEVAAKGMVVAACMDRNTQRAMPLPPEVKRKLTAAMGR